jgi:hypothetical protein
MATNKFGRTGGFVSMGEIIDRMDPTQSGQHKVKWKTGGANQDQMGGNDDHPWSKTLSPSHNPSLNQTGGPHTGMRPGTKVMGISMDGQDFFILGTMPSSGKGSADGSPTYDSDIPQHAKDSSSGGDGVGAQPRNGDVRLQLKEDDSGAPMDSDGGGDSKSITKWAEEESTNGKADKPAKETVANGDAETA